MHGKSLRFHGNPINGKELFYGSPQYTNSSFFPNTTQVPDPWLYNRARWGSGAMAIPLVAQSSTTTRLKSVFLDYESPPARGHLGATHATGAQRVLVEMAWREHTSSFLAAAVLRRSQTVVVDPSLSVSFRVGPLGLPYAPLRHEVRRPPWAKECFPGTVLGRLGPWVRRRCCRLSLPLC